MKNLHIVKRDDGWAVKAENSSYDQSLHRYQDDAFKAARNQAQIAGGEVFIHGRDGKIRERNTYGKDDPFPPPG